jgi:hypothetical protein
MLFGEIISSFLEYSLQYALNWGSFIPVLGQLQTSKTNEGYLRIFGLHENIFACDSDSALLDSIHNFDSDYGGDVSMARIDVRWIRKQSHLDTLSYKSNHTKELTCFLAEGII